MEHIKKNDFIQIEYTGYSNGEVFDSNIEADLKKLNPEGKANELIIVVGQGMVVSGLDKALEGKETGKEYKINLAAKEAFGERKRDMLKTLPLKAFTSKNFEPRPGMILTLDDSLVKVVSVSGARVMIDFNNPMAGKEIEYKFIIKKKIDSVEEKTKAMFESLLKFVPEFSVGEKIVIKGPAIFESLVKALGDKFKELVGKELAFELKELTKEEKEKMHAAAHDHEGHDHGHGHDHADHHGHGHSHDAEHKH